MLSNANFNRVYMDLVMQISAREWEVFRAIAEHGGVTPAATSLGMSQPAASKMLAQAEARLGFALFARERKRLSVTPEGRHLLPALVSALTAMQDLHRLAEDLRQGRSGQVSIAAVPAFTTVMLPAALKAFQARHPGVSVIVRAHTTLEAIDLVAERRADFGIGLGQVTDPRVTVEALCEEPIGCVLPKGHRLARRAELTVADLMQHPLICAGEHQPVGRLLAQLFSGVGQKVAVAVEASLSTICCAMVAQGVGVAVVDGSGLREARNMGLIVRGLRPSAHITTSLIVARNRQSSLLTKALIDALKEVVAQAPPAVLV